MRMDPNAEPPPLVSPEPEKSGQYDFFLNDQPSAKQPLLGKIGRLSKKVKIAVAATILVVLLIIASTVASFFSTGAGDDEKKLQLLGISKQQNEIVRIAGVGAKKAHRTEAKNLALTTKLGMATEQANLQAALKTQDVRARSSLLDKDKRVKNDQTLTVAEQNNRFDDAFLELMYAEIAIYQKELKIAYDDAESKAFKDAIAHQYRIANNLAGLAPDEGL